MVDIILHGYYITMKLILAYIQLIYQFMVQFMSDTYLLHFVCYVKQSLTRCMALIVVFYDLKLLYRHKSK